jgi:hypothetical protein
MEAAVDQIRPKEQEHSYRARIQLGEYDWNAPEAHTQVIGLKAASHQRALLSALWVCGRPVLELWRQDGTFCTGDLPIGKCKLDFQRHGPVVAIREPFTRESVAAVKHPRTGQLVPLLGEVS